MVMKRPSPKQTHLATLLLATVIYRQIYKSFDKTGTDEYKQRAQWLRAFFLYRIAMKIITVFTVKKEYQSQYHIFVSVLVKLSLAIGNLRAAHYAASKDKIVSQHELKSARMIYFLAKGATDINRFTNAFGWRTPEPILHLFKNTVVFFTHYAESGMSGNIAWCFAYTIGYIVLNMRNRIDIENNKENKLPNNALFFVIYLFICGACMDQLEWIFSLTNAF
eukprot:349741_1